MFKITKVAIAKLQALVIEHPEDPIVRITVQDQDERKITFSITLEDKVRADDEVQEMNGLTVALDVTSAPRMNGVTLDYQQSSGFSFIHPKAEGHHDEFPLNPINLN